MISCDQFLCELDLNFPKADASVLTFFGIYGVGLLREQIMNLS